MEDSNYEFKRKIVNEINQKYGLTFKNKETCLEIYQHYVDKRNSILVKIDVLNTENKLSKVINEAKEATDKIDRIVENSEGVVKEINTNLDEIDELRKETKLHFDRLNTLETTLQYLRVVQRIELICTELQREVAKKDDENCATLFANLCEISRNLTDFTGTHLRSYLRDTLHYWHNILKEKLAKDFDEVLKQIKWPFVSANFSMVQPLTAYIQKLQIITEYLLQIEIPSESSLPLITSALLSDFPALCLPIQLLVLPLKKRFLYHFHGTRQTNRPDKPEWYFTQILTWIRDHREFVGKWIQPVIDKLGLHHIDAKLELTRGLVQLGVEKLHADLPNLQYDDFSFSHCIDEALGFDKELRETYNYPNHQPSVIAVITQAQIFIKWINMEKKYAVEKMDAMLSPTLSDPFEPLTSDVEDLKITTCADAFITLQQTIMERYEALPQPGHRLQFLELQLELLDDFRVRLLQIVNAEEGDIIESKIPMIANTIYYIENVLIDWGAMLHYLNLYYYKSQLEVPKSGPSSPNLKDFDDSPTTDIETVFADTLSLYRHMRRDLLNTLAEFVISEVKKRSRNYRHENWNQMVSTEKEFKTLSLTSSACPIFEVIAKRLHQLQKTLEAKLFTMVWRNLAIQLDTFLFEDLVLDNRFSTGGALQFKYDVTRNLLPLFSQFSEKPESYFTKVIESSNLLNITKGSALLLRETILALEEATGVEDTRGKALQEMGVKHFTPKMAVKILNQRTDITINRIIVD